MLVDTAWLSSGIGFAGFMVKLITDRRPIDELREISNAWKGRQVDVIQQTLDAHREQVSREVNRILVLARTGTPDNAADMEIESAPLRIEEVCETCRQSEDWIRRVAAARLRTTAGVCLFALITVLSLVLVGLYFLGVKIPDWMAVVLVISSIFLGIVAVVDAVARSILINSAKDRLKPYKLQVG